MRTFISGLNLAVSLSQGSSRLTEELQRLTQIKPAGDDAAAIKTLEPVLDVLLESVQNES